MGRGVPGDILHNLIGAVINNEIKSGGKARGLKLLESLGVGVPDWIEIDPIWDYSQIQKLVDLKFGKSSRENYYAVRSSATLEDGREQSFAGMFHTELNVSYPDLKRAISHCLTLAQEKHLKIYSQSKPFKFYLVIQKMIQASFAGVLFSCHPQFKPNEILIEWARGLGDQVVSGVGAVNSLTYFKLQRIWSHSLISPALCGTPSIHCLEQLVKLALEMERKLGYFVDLEWAVDAQEKLWILQLRPITKLPLTGLTVLDNSNIGENYPGITLPLSVSVLKKAYALNFYHLMHRLSFPVDFIQYSEPIIEEMVVAPEGRTYYRLENWIKIISSFPIWGNKLVASFKKMIGSELSDQYFEFSKNTFSPIQSLKILSSFIFHFLKRHRFEYEYKIKSDEIFNHLEKGLEGQKSVPQRLDELEYWLIEFTKISTYGFFNDLLCAIFYSWLEHRLDLEIPGKKSQVLHQFMSRGDLLKSHQGFLWVQKIASSLLLEHRQAIEKISTDQEAQIFLNSLPEDLKEEIHQYLTEFGERVPGEMKIEIGGYQERLRDFFKLLTGLPTSYPENHAEAFTVNSMTHQLLKIYYSLIAFREYSRLCRLRSKSYIRKYLLKIGHELMLQGQLDSIDQLYYLDYQSFIRLGDDLAPAPDFKAASWTGQVWDQTLAFRGFESYAIKRDIFIESELKGIACSGGEVEGEVIIVDDPHLVKDVSNKIVIAAATDPGWMMVILKCKGLLIERGNLLSHTAIIGRELNLPVLVGVKGALSVLKNGDRVWFNGATGEIKILASS